ncbi:MAG: DUF4114 domain-containing protein [Planktothrix sp. GU0601_MAG3]|nr:MAG: DUF4114 domain-containing protein [Planktothrix sp. GU0601_MAG3]
MAFEFYEDPQQPNQYLFYEKYIDGAALTEHLGTQYTKDFFASFAPLLVGNGIADADVNIYSMHAPGSPLSQVYSVQKGGVELLNQLFQETPQLSITLTSSQGLFAANNQNQTPGIGINLLFTTENSGNQPVEYGVFQVDDSNNSIKGLLPNQPGYLEAVRERAVPLFNTHVNQGSALPNPSRNLPVQTTHGYAIYQVTGGSLKDSNAIVNLSFQDPQFVMQPNGQGLSFQFSNGLGGSVALNGPIQNFQDTISQPQRRGFNIFDTSTITDRQIKTDVQVVKDSELIHQIGFYPVKDEQGTVLDPVTNTLVKPGDPNYANVALSQATNFQFNTGTLTPGQVTNLDDFVINSGNLYAPVVTTIADTSTTYFAYKEANPDQSTRIISLGTNSFGIEDGRIGATDNDFNDVMFSLNFTFAEPPYPIV